MKKFVALGLVSSLGFASSVVAASGGAGPLGQTVISNGVSLVLGGGGAAIGSFGTGANWRVNSTAIASPPFTGDRLTLTDNAGSQSRNVYFTQRQSVTGGFAQTVTFQAAGNRAADGWGFVVQNDGRGTNAVGSPGGTLALNTITQSVAVAFNIHNTDGVRLLTNGVTIGNYQASAPVALDSGNPVSVTVLHTPASQELLVLLAEQGTTNRKSFLFSNVNVEAQTKTNAAYVGFAGATGGSAATQLLGGQASFFNNVLEVGTDVVLPVGGVLDLNSHGQAVASLWDEGSAGGVVTNGGLAGAMLGFAPTNGAVTSFAGTISDGAGTNVISVVMMGDGVQALTGANSHRGGTFVNGGTLRIGTEANLGAGATAVTLAGGTLSVISPVTFSRPVAVTMGGTLDVASGVSVTVTNNGFSAGSAGLLVKAGLGDLFIAQPTGLNPWTGNLVVNGGQVVLSGGGDTAFRGAGIAVNNGGTLRLVGGNIIINTATISVNAGGTFEMNNAPEAFAFLSGAGVVSNTAGIELDLGAASNTFSGPIEGFGPLNVRGANSAAGIQTLRGTNTFTGGVRLSAGTLAVAEDVNLGASTGAVTFAGGTLRVLGTALANLDGRPVNWTNFSGGLDIAAPAQDFTVTNVILGTGALAKLGAGSLTLTAANSYSGATTITGTLKIAAGATIGSTLVTINMGGRLAMDTSPALPTGAVINVLSNTILAGRIALSNGVNQTVYSLMLNGSAAMIGTYGATGSGAMFTNDAVFEGTGILSVQAGLSSSPSDSSWAADASGNWNVASNWTGGLIAFGTNATAYFTNTITADRTVTNTYTPVDIGNLVFNSASNNWTVLGTALNLATTGGTPMISVSANAATITAVITGAQGVAKSGAGTLNFNTVNAYAGPTEVNQGTLQLTGAGSIYGGAAGTGTVTVASGGTFQFARNDSFGNHAAVPQSTITVQQGGLLQNTGAVFNTLRNVTLSGGELRANGGASATFQAFQLKGTITVSGASASLISAPAPTNVFHQIQVGDNSTGGVTVLDVADVTGDAAADLKVSAGFANGRNAAGNAPVTSGIQKKGAGTVQLTGSSINTGPLQMDGSRVVISGGALNSPVVLTNSASLVAEDGPGLMGEFYSVTAAAANFVNPQLLSAHMGTLQPSLAYNGPLIGTNFDFGTTGAFMPPAGMTVIEGRWRGKFIAPTNGTYIFGSASDDGSMVWINGTNVVNNNFGQAITTRVGSITLDAGVYDIELDFYNSGGAGGYFVDVTPPGGTSNRLALASLLTGPAIGSLLGDSSGAVILSNTTLSVLHGTNSTFDGTISGDGTFRKLGTGILTLGGANSPTNWILGGGRLGISSDANLGAGVPVNFDGGFLRVTGTGVANIHSHPINAATFVGGFDIADAAHTFSVTQNLGTVLGSSILWKQGAGTLPMIGSSNTLNAGFTVYNGALVLQDAALVTRSNVADHVGSVAGDSGSLILRGDSLVTRGLNNFIVGNAAGATGSLTVAGNSRVTGSAFSPLYVGNSGRGLLTVTDNGFVSNRLIVGNNAGSAGALHLRGGNVFNNDGSTQDSAFGWNTGAYGYLGVFAGAFTNRGWMWIGGNNGAGVLQMTGGNFNHTGLDGGFDISRGGTGVVHLAGGTFTVTANNVNMIANGNNSGLAVLTVTTNATASILAGSVVLGNRSNGLSVVNLNGGSLRANAISKGLAVVSNFAIVNFDGGTVRANVGGNLLGATSNMPNQVNIYGGGATFDTMTGLVVTINPNLNAPVGNGVVSIPVATSGSGYIGSPIVNITGGGGTGATAFAVVELDTNSASYGQLTSVLITSPGQGYTGTPTVVLQGGGPITAATLGVVTMASVTSGPVTITGGGLLSLLGTNTYSGGTIISNMILLIGSTNAVGSGPITIAGNTAGIGPAFAIGQDFVNWLTSRTTVVSSTALLGIGANSASNLDLTALTNWGITAAGGSYTLNGGVAIAGTNLYLGGGVGTLTFVPTIGTGTNVFIGYAGGSVTGVVVLAGTNNAYGSEINLLSGILRAGRASAFGSTSSVVNVSAGTTLDIAGQNLGNVNVFAQGTGANGIGAIVNTGADQISALQRVTLTGDARVGGSGRWDVRGAGSYLDLAGYTLTKTNGNVLGVVGGSLTDGNIIIGQGTLALHAGVTATGGTGRITIRPGTSLDFYATPSPVVTVTITNEGGTISSSSGTADASVIGSPVGLGGATNTFLVASPSSLTLTGVVSGSGVALKTGTGPLILMAPSTFSGQLVVNGGTVELAASDTNDGVLGRSSSVIVSNGAIVVDFSDSLFGTNTPPVVLRSQGLLGTSNGVFATLAGSITLAGGTIGGAAPDATYGTWILKTNLTATTNASITAPRIQLASAGGNALDVAASSTLNSGTSYENPSPTGTGTLVKIGSGTLTLAGASTYSGPTLINAGTVKLANTPGPVAGMSYWLDAADTATIVLDTSGKVSQWTDKSGNALNFAQANAVQRPAYLTAGLNGKPSLRFDGVTNQLTLNSPTTPQTVFIVNRPTQYTALNGIWGIPGGDKGIRMSTAATWQNTGDANDFIFGAGGAVLINGIPTNNFGGLGTPHVLTEVRGAGHVAAYGTTALGIYFNAGRVWQGDICEVLVYPTVLSATDRKQVEKYLYNKWFYGSSGATNDVLPTNTIVQLASGAMLDLNGVSQTIGALNGASGVVDNTDSNEPAVLFIGSDEVNGDFGGQIGPTGAVALVKIGLATQILRGVNAVNGGFIVSNGALIVNGFIGGTNLNWLQGGALGGTGVVAGQILNFGTTILPGEPDGDATGTLTFTNDYAAIGGAMSLELAGTNFGLDHDLIVVGGNAALAGSLTINLITGYLPVVGSVYTILNAQVVSGIFDTTNLPLLANTNHFWNLEYNTNAVVLSLTGIVVSTGYDLYALQITNGLTGIQDDADTDGFANLYEYVTGSNPTNPASGNALAAARTNGMLALRFLRDTNTVDATLIVEGAYGATNNADWIGFATNLNGNWGSATNVIEDGNQPANVAAFDVAPAATNRFLRLRITRP